MGDSDPELLEALDWSKQATFKSCLSAPQLGDLGKSLSPSGLITHL